MFSNALTRPKGRVTAIAAVSISLGFAALFAVLAGGSASADAARAKPTIWLGQTAQMPDPLCPVNCQVIPSVSGIQSKLPTGQEPYRANADGEVTAWRMYLGKPTNRDRTALNAEFGSPPKAGITILQRIKTREGKIKFLLKRKSPVKSLSKELGGLATFKLQKPLYVKKGQFVALAVPTWAPAFAAGLDSRSYGWRASRQPGMCGSGSAEMATPQLKAGSKRFYACSYSGSRLLFTAKLRLR
jgi:hypothetical protein